MGSVRNIGKLLSLFSCCMTAKLLPQCASFLTAVQMLVGIFWPSMMKLRSQYVPEGIRATTLNLFRVPLNLFVCLVLYNVRPPLFPDCVLHSSLNKHRCPCASQEPGHSLHDSLLCPYLYSLRLRRPSVPVLC